MHYGWGAGGFFAFMNVVAQVLGTIVIAGALIGVTVLLVRFLLVATRAAQLYVAEHQTATPAADPRAFAPEQPSAAAPAPTDTAAAPATKPAAKPRTPKTPPAG